MKTIPVSVIAHWIATGLALVISVATIVAANSTDGKLAGSAATVLSIAAILKKLVDQVDNKAAIATVVPAVQAAASGNPAQQEAVASTLKAL